MVNEANSITILKECYGDRLYVEDQADLQAELLEGNDKSAIITIVVMCVSSIEARMGLARPSCQGSTLARQYGQPCFAHPPVCLSQLQPQLLNKVALRPP